MGDLDTRDNETFLPPNMAEPKGYGLSGKIMLSAIVILFSVVIIMVCLHIYARWYILNARRRQIRRARRRTHLVFYIEPNNPSNIVPIPTRGLDARVLHSLPTFKYKPSSEDHQVLECAVCLSEFEDGERGRLLPKCKHSFHVDCIDMWFHSHSTCPICRSSVDLDDQDCVNFKSGVNVGGGGDGEGLLPPPLEDVVVELATESTPSQLGPSSELDGPSQPTAATGCSSFGGRRKGVVGVSSIEVPTRSQSFSFTTNSDESGPSPSPSQGFKSPTSRILSLKRILSREKRSSLPSPSGVGTSRCNGSELDLEFGRVEETSHQPSQVLTPKN